MGAFAGAAISIGGSLLASSLAGDGDGGGDEGAGISQAAIEELKRQFGLVEENVQPFIDVGARQIPGVERAATVGGLDEILGEIFGTETFRNLVGERTRGVQGALSAGGLTRSGTAVQELSAVPQDIGLAIEQLISGRQTDLFKTGLGATLDLGGLGIQGASAQAGVGSAQAQRSFQAGQGASSRRSDLIGGLIGGGGSIIGGLAQSGFFNSDPWLKENVEIIGKIGSLNLYQWDWRPEVADTFIGKFPTIGFMADEVKKLYPQFVKPLFGFDAVHYSNLLDKIESENVLAAA
jgi:hypothetical protein